MAEVLASPGSRPPLLTLLSDHPIESDRENSPDLLDLHERLGAPLDILRHPATRTPFTIALYGDWGTGKTSAMRWLHSQLLVWNDSPLRSDHPKITPVWFYPWKYHKREDVWRGIIAEVILATLKAGKSDDFSERAVHVAKRYGKFLGHSFLHILANTKIKGDVKASAGIPAAAKVEASKSIELNGQAVRDIYDEYKKVTEPHAPYLNDFEAQLTDWVRDTFDDKTHRLVLFIDDLDRCMPDVALEVLEALKLYLNIPGLLFVAGLDRGVIDQIVTKHYEKSGVHERVALRYLDKLFQVEIDVAPSQTKVSAYLDKKIRQLDDATGGLWSQSLSTDHGADHNYRQIIETAIRRLGNHNPRAFTRILNSLLTVSHAALTTTPVVVDPVDHEAEKCLRFAQGAQVYLLRRLLHDFTARAENLLRTEGGQKWIERLSVFRRENPEYIPPVKNTPSDGGASVHMPEKPESQKDAESPEFRFKKLLEETKTLEDASGAFEAILQYGWDLLLIPFSSSVAAAVPQEKKEVDSIPKPAGLEGMPAEILAAIARSLNVPISEVTPASLREVDELSLRNTQVSDLGPLKDLPILRRLYLNNTQVSDLGPLKTLNTLGSLDLSSTQVSDLGPLKNLTALGLLSLDGSRVSDLGPLENLTGLVSLSLDGTEVSNLGPLENLTALAYLYLGGLKVGDLGPLRNLMFLECLYLDGTQVSDLGPLRNLTALERIYLDGTGVSDLGPLENLSLLECIDLDNTEVSDLGPLQTLTRLHELHLCNTQVSDLSPLHGLKGLVNLWLTNTPAEKDHDGIAAIRESLPNLEIR